MSLLLAHTGPHAPAPVTFASFGGQWLWLAVPLGVGALVVAYLAVSGGPGPLLRRVCNSLERVTGLPAWSAGGIGMGLLALVVAVLGFYWDVAWHIELGRDQFIFTPAHTAILLGIALIIVASLTAIVLATYQRADVRLSFGFVRVPVGSLPLLVLGGGAILGFPLDELWHRAYGIDVTMWGPTHLVMISGASLTPLGLWILYNEGRKSAVPTRLGRTVAEVLAGALVVGLSTWTGEFDFGVPQFQALYHPLLVVAPSALGLVAARYLLGPGGALRAAIGAVVLRALVALALGAGLGLVIPRFPIFVFTGLMVEAGFIATRRLTPARAALVVGALVGTAGLAVEWMWMDLWGRHPWTTALLPGLWIVPVAAVAAAVLGAGFGRTVAGEAVAVSKRALALAAVVLIACLVAPLPRHDAAVAATVDVQPAGPGRAMVSVALDPPDAAAGANWFEVLSWQGGSMRLNELREVEPGLYRAVNEVPVNGSWKSILRLARDDQIVGAGIYLPADPEISAPELKLTGSTRVELERDTSFLMREAFEGAAWPAVVAYSTIAVLAVVWIGTIVWACTALYRRDPVPGQRVRLRSRQEAA